MGGARIAAFFIMLTLLFFTLVSGVLLTIGLLRDAGAFVLGGLVVFACELIAAYVLKKSGYYEELMCGDEHGE